MAILFCSSPVICHLLSVICHLSSVLPDDVACNCYTDQYTDLLTDDAEIKASDKYFAEVQTEYIRVLNDIKEVIKTNIAKPKIKTETNSDELTREELLGLVYMPKVELQAFDGNPLQYHQFINSFDQNVDRICKDGDMKLTRLLQYTSGEAKEAIRACQLIGGDEGYEEA